MQLITDEEKRNRIEEMAGFRAVLDVDFEPTDNKAPYEKIYNDYINGIITSEEFSQKLNVIINTPGLINSQSQFQDENEMSLPPEEAEKFKAEHLKNDLSAH